MDGLEYSDDEDISGAVDHDDFADLDVPVDFLARVAERLLSDDHPAPSLSGYVIPKKNGQLRALAVPPFADRVAQRAVAQVVSTILEPFMSDSSHGYRKGRSRIGAKDRIAAAYRQGYRWIYEADIRAFFNNVNRGHLANRLVALFGDDPIVDFILKRMAADVVYQGRTIARPWGIPQGSPLSPIMANVMLDDLDRDLDHDGFKLIRYADDFVVLCRSREEAEAASQRVIASLEETGLSIHDDKSGIVSFDQGFRFLGYYFQNNIILDGTVRPKTKVRRSDIARDGQASPPDPNADHHWLSDFQRSPHHQAPQPLDFGEDSGEDSGDVGLISDRGTAEADPREVTAEHEDQGQGATLFITGGRMVLSTLHSRLVVKDESDRVVNHAWRNIGSLVLIGSHHITTPALRTAMWFGVPVHFVSINGRYQGIASKPVSTRDEQALWLQQLALFSQNDVTLILAREVVAARLRHQREVLRLLGKEEFSEQRLLIRDLSRKLLNATDLKQLNGYEGSATATYFSALKHRVPSSWGFESRINRHASDPFNALLSLGYTILYQYVDSLLRVAGLNPWSGFYHQGRGNHRALASDMMEPFRHVVERTALSMARRKSLKPEHFSWNGAKHRLELDSASRKVWLSALSAQMNRGYRNEYNKKMTLVDAIGQQNQSLKNCIRSNTRFVAWKMP